MNRTVRYFQLTETRDFGGQRERVNAAHRGYSSPEWWLRHESWDSDPNYPTFVVADGAVAKVNGGKFTRFSSSHLQDAEEDLAFDPIQLLLTAQASPDLHVEADRLYHGFEHHVLGWNKLLYTGDLFAPDTDDTWFTPEYLLEFKHAVLRENLHVENIFGMHYDLTPYAKIDGALGTYMKKN